MEKTSKRSYRKRPLPDGYLTTQMVAEEMGVHEVTVHRWVRTGIITCHRIKGHRANLFLAADVALMKNGR